MDLTLQQIVAFADAPIVALLAFWMYRVDVHVKLLTQRVNTMISVLEKRIDGLNVTHLPHRHSARGAANGDTQG